MRYSNYLNDSIALVSGSFTKKMETFKVAIDNIKKYNLLDSSIIWRGFKKKRTGDFIYKIINDRSGFRGNLEPKVQEVIDNLKLSSAPVFTTKEYNNARFFGDARVFIPDGDFISCMNPDVDDILVSVREGDINKIISGYLRYVNIIPSTKNWQELILSCKSYYLVSPQHMLILSSKGKYSTIKNIRDLKSYHDIIKLYNEYISYLKWFYNMRLKDNPKMKDYYQKNYPKDWFGGKI